METPFDTGATIHQHGEFRKKLELGRPLRIKYGIDPTAASVHLGHLVGLLKLRQFQQHGHKPVLILGTFTAMVGDPTGRDETRPRMTKDVVKKNAEQYLEQIAKIIDLDKAEIHYNDSWFSQMGSHLMVDLLAQATVQQILTRDDFDKRMNDNQPIFMHEMLYPLLQGFDSIQVAADVEIGGRDQLFNFMLARDMQKKAGQEPQVCLTMPILRGLDGHRRMGKSLGNYIGINESPDEIFAKTMSIPDELMEEWWTLLPVDDVKWKTIMPPPEFQPMHAKKILAGRLVKFIHNHDASEKAYRAWHDRFSLKKDPDNMPEIKTQDNVWICKLLVDGGLAKSNNDARRLIEAGGVTIGPEREKITDPKANINIKEPLVLRVGSRRSVKVYPIG